MLHKDVSRFDLGISRAENLWPSKLAELQSVSANTANGWDGGSCSSATLGGPNLSHTCIKRVMVGKTENSHYQPDWAM